MLVTAASSELILCKEADSAHELHDYKTRLNKMSKVFQMTKLLQVLASSPQVQLPEWGNSLLQLMPFLNRGCNVIVVCDFDKLGSSVDLFWPQSSDSFLFQLVCTSVSMVNPSILLYKTDS
jgi:hypothetical protein